METELNVLETGLKSNELCVLDENEARETYGGSEYVYVLLDGKIVCIEINK